MIIRFDRTPEELYRLSTEARARGELDRALLYAEDALRGKGSMEYKVALAEILVDMGRYADAANVAMEALSYGTGMRAELYEVLAHSSSELGHYYESFHYLAKKAHYEGDEDTLDAMDAVIAELDAGEPPLAEERDLYLVGKESQGKKPDPTSLLRAGFALNHGEFTEAIRLASLTEKGSAHYVESRMILLRAHLQRRDNERALETAEELAELDPKNGFVLYVLIEKLKKKEYIPRLAAVAEGGSEVYYAILAAESAGDHPLAVKLSEVLLSSNPYVPGAYFVAAAVSLNGGDRKGSEDHLRALFALYRRYPQEAILKGWRRLKRCDAAFSGRMPREIVCILERYVLRRARTSEEFVTSMLNESFRSAVMLVLEQGDRRSTARILSLLSEIDNKHVDAFFARALLRYDVDLILKREIFARLYFRKEKGRLFVAQSVVPVRVSCLKPAFWGSAPIAVRRTYAEIYAFLTCMSDVSCEDRLATLSERIARIEGAEDLSEGVICAAMIIRLLADGDIPPADGAPTEEDTCVFFLQFIFGFTRVNMRRARLLAEIIAD